MSKKKVLVCDDDEGIVEITSLLLTRSGFTVLPTTQGEKVISMLQQDKPDLLLVDLWMPGISGDKIIRSMKGLEDFKNLPVIVFSASPEGQDIAREAGADAFIAKPFDLSLLVETINRVVNISA